ncbi:MAG: hypothetical protein AAF215_05005 [Cyanobacteria bacterium P01_A01_bin.123]
MKLWLSWTLITALGWLISAYLGAFIGFEDDTAYIASFFNVGNNFEWGIVYGLIYGLIVGISSWVFLHNRIRLSALWIPLTFLGFAVGNGLGSYLNAWAYDNIEAVDSGVQLFLDSWYGIVNGFWVALCQSSVLRNTHINAYSWFKAAWLSIALGEFLGWAILWQILPIALLDFSPALADMMAGSLVGLIVGGITGLVLIAAPQETDLFD